MNYIIIAGNLPCIKTRYGTLILILALIEFCLMMYYPARIIDNLVTKKKLGFTFKQIITILLILIVIFFTIVILHNNNYSLC